MAANSLFPPTRLVQIRKLVRFAKGRGYAHFSDLGPDSDQFTTSGILLRIKRMTKANLVFGVLTDGRDHIQVIFTSEIAGAAKLQSLQRGLRVSVTGIPLEAGRTSEQAVASLYVTHVHSVSSPTPLMFDEDGLREEVTPRLVIGYLMAYLSDVLENAGYVRYEPQFITGSRIDVETQPLMVTFPGRGAEVFLEVSPLPQLLYAAVTMARPKLFAPSRLFSRAYRDGFTSADSPIVAAVEVELGEEKKPSVEELADALVSSLPAAQNSELPFELIPESAKGSIRITSRDLPGPIESNHAYDVRRLLTVRSPSGQVIIEGHEGKIAQSIPYHWLCIHIERLVLGDLWRITQRRGLEPGIR